MADVICFGEVMLRLTTSNFSRLTDAQSLEITFGGAEANAAVQFAAFGGSADFVSRLPANAIGDRCIEELCRRGVGTRWVLRGGSRIGVYFLEPGAGQRPGCVTYDRAQSAVSEMKPGMVDWDAAFAGARWFHWSGITPALSEGCAALCREACEVAKRRGLTVSFDVNFRSKLWSAQEAAAGLQPLMRFVDVCVAGESDAAEVLGVSASGEATEKRLPEVAGELAAKYGFKAVAMTWRTGESASHTTLQAMLHAAGGAHFSRRHEITNVDRVGAGDSFTGALIFAMLRGDEPARAIEFAAAAGAWKHTIPGDWNRCSVAEVEALADGAGGARIGR
jgi:2-dehydro-3-deoxygluconokinase